MKSRNEMHRTVLNVVNHAKDSATQQLVAAAVRGEIKIPREELPRVVALINSAVETAYHQSHRGIETAIQKLEVEAKSTKKSSQ